MHSKKMCIRDSYVGAVVGATYPEQGKVLRKVLPKAFILVPGYGAQGGKGADLVHFFNADGPVSYTHLQAFSSFDTYLAPFVKVDHLSLSLIHISEGMSAEGPEE